LIDQNVPTAKRVLAWTVLATSTLGVTGCGSAERADGSAVHGRLRPVTLDGLGNPHNYGFHRLYHFQGYLWTVSGNSVEGAIV
jgi:hypothetical protein